MVWRKIGFHVLIFTLLTTSCMNDLAANLQKPFEADDTGVLLDPGILLPVGYQVQDLTLSAQMTNQSKIKKWESCEALSHSVANNTLLDFYGYYKSNSRCEPALLMSMEDSDDGATATALPSYTEQNSQVENVIEADVVFANANQLFQLDRDAIHVYNTWPATDFKEVGVLENPIAGERVDFEKMILTDDTLVVFAERYEITVENNGWGDYNTYQSVGFLVLNYALQEQSAPKLVSQNQYTNSNFITARVADGNLYIFGDSNLTPDAQPNYYPEELHFDNATMCNDEYELNQTGVNAVNTYLESLAQNLKDYDVTARLPEFQSLNNAFDASNTEVLDCQNVYATNLSDGAHVVWSDVVDLNAIANTATASTAFDIAIQSTSNNVYMTHENLVFYGDVNLWRYDLIDDSANSVDGTVLNVFAIDPDAVQPYSALASSVVAGTVDSPWQFDLKGDQLRVVTEIRAEQNDSFSFWIPQAPTEVRFYDLKVSNKNLTVVGEIANLVSGEEIYGVRYVGDQAYVVTMLTEYYWDPLFIIDTKDFVAPQVLGSLEMPGFSAYLELLDDNVLLGVGYNIGGTGGWLANEELKVSLYSVADATLPSELTNYIIEDSYSYSSISHLQIHLDESDGDQKLFVPYQLYNETENLYSQKLDILSLSTEGVELLLQYDLDELEEYDEVKRTIRYHDETADVLYVVSSEKVVQLSLEDL